MFGVAPAEHDWYYTVVLAGFIQALEQRSALPEGAVSLAWSIATDEAAGVGFRTNDDAKVPSLYLAEHPSGPAFRR